ncbi:TGM2 glutamyltransferase, partial [Atractosteus spatula]|nr:TGM2 glutamyltransferase [Atractosteus spatula]
LSLRNSGSLVYRTPPLCSPCVRANLLSYQRMSGNRAVNYSEFPEGKDACSDIGSGKVMLPPSMGADLGCPCAAQSEGGGWLQTCWQRGRPGQPLLEPQYKYSTWSPGTRAAEKPARRGERWQSVLGQEAPGDGGLSVQSRALVLCRCTGLLEAVDLQCWTNNRQHHSEEIDTERLLLRRGQPFSLTARSAGPPPQPPARRLAIVLQLGRDGDTVIKVSDSRGPAEQWWFSVQPAQGELLLTVHSPPDAPVGYYRMNIVVLDSDGLILQQMPAGSFFLLFNPWCKDDAVHLSGEEQLQEYIMNESGLLFQGSWDQINTLPWDFGQFERDVVDICFQILDNSPAALRSPRADALSRSDPVYVSRTVTAMVNANDDRGVVSGRWDGDYSDGVAPTRWTGSVAILRRWSRGGAQRVQYGQCWVFSGVACTVLRCLGIPTRCVTNYSSAHDTDGNLTVDQCYNEQLESLPAAGKDMIWNYHCWVESWMARPDLPRDYWGWQVLDPTPQERSDGRDGDTVIKVSDSRGPAEQWWFSVQPAQGELLLTVHSPPDAPVGYYRMNIVVLDSDGLILQQMPAGSFFLLFNPWCKGVFCCGPCPVRAVKEGDVDVKYDAPFVFSEVNADLACWVVRADGRRSRAALQCHSVGRNISTKSIYGEQREDLTHHYKYPEGSAMERQVYAKAGRKLALRGSGAGQLELGIKHAQAVHGSDFDVYVHVWNRGGEEQRGQLTIIARAVTYNGIRLGECHRKTTSLALPAGAAHREVLRVRYEQYGERLSEHHLIRVTALVEPHGRPDVTLHEINIPLSVPRLVVKVIGEAVVSQPLKAQITFVNPLPVTLRGGVFTAEGAGLTGELQLEALEEIGPGQTLTVQVSFKPSKPGLRTLLVDFDTDKLKDVKGLAKVSVRPKAQ